MEAWRVDVRGEEKESGAGSRCEGGEGKASRFCVTVLIHTYSMNWLCAYSLTQASSDSVKL